MIRRLAQPKTEPKLCLALYTGCSRMGKFCNIAGRPVNIGSCMLRKSVAKMKGKCGGRSTGTALGHVAKLSCKSSVLFHGSGCPDSTNPIRPDPAEVPRPEGPRNGALGDHSCDNEQPATQAPWDPVGSLSSGETVGRTGIRRPRTARVGDFAVQELRDRV